MSASREGCTCSFQSKRFMLTFPSPFQLCCVSKTQLMTRPPTLGHEKTAHMKLPAFSALSCMLALWTGKGSRPCDLQHDYSARHCKGRLMLTQQWGTSNHIVRGASTKGTIIALVSTSVSLFCVKSARIYYAIIIDSVMRLRWPTSRLTLFVKKLITLVFTSVYITTLSFLNVVKAILRK